MDDASAATLRFSTSGSLFVNHQRLQVFQAPPQMLNGND